MGGGSHCWVTCFSLGLPGAALVSPSSALIPATPPLLPQPRVSSLQPRKPRHPHVLPPGSSPQPSATLFPSPLPARFPAPVPARHLGSPTSFLPASGPAYGPALTTPVYIHWLDFYYAPPPRLSLLRLGQRAVCQRRRLATGLGRSRGKSGLQPERQIRWTLRRRARTSVSGAVDLRLGVGEGHRPGGPEGAA